MTTYLYAVGVNHYHPPIQTLRCCESDAREIVAVFGERFGFRVKYLEARDTEGVLSGVRGLEDHLAEGDTFIFYFSGHGKSHADDEFLLLPAADLDDLTECSGGTSAVGTLSYNHLKRLTSRGRWKNVRRLFILDACRSKLLPDKAGQVAICESEYLLRDMHLVRTSARKDDEWQMSVFNSCSLGASAAELPHLEHGLFTAVLLDRLRSAAETHRPLRVDSELCASMAVDMQACARKARLPSHVWHSPAFVGTPIDLIPRTTPFRERETDRSGVANEAAKSASGALSLTTKPSLYPKTGTGAIRVKADPGQLPAASSVAKRRSATRASTPADSERSVQRKRDERLWLLASREHSAEAYQHFLVQASAGAPQRASAIDQIQRLATTQAVRGQTLVPSPGKKDERQAHQIRRGPQDWQPEPAPEFKLSLDKPLRMLGKKLGRN